MTEVKGGARDVLVVDDSKTTSKFIKAVLEKIGLSVRLAHSGPAGLAEIHRALPDLVICDVVMPGMSGLDVVRDIRANPRTQGLPVILLTSMKTLDDRVRGLETGADDYVLKPFQIAELCARVRSHLRMKALQDEVAQRNAQLEEARGLLTEKLDSLRTAYQRISEEDARRRHDLALAAKVQHGLLPRAFPAMPGLSFHARFDPALEVAGDFYDVFTLPDGRVALVVGDVAGKGIPASLVMVLVQTLVRTEAAAAGSPGMMLERVNGRLIREMATPNAVTLFAGFLDPRTGILDFANGGHEYPLLGLFDGPGGRASGRDARPMELCVGGPFLGVFPTARYNEGQVRISAGDRLLMFTDGVYHMTGPDGPIRGSEDVGRLLERHTGDTPEVLLRAFADGTDQGETTTGKDDVTLLLVDCLAVPAHEEQAQVWIYNDPVNLREVVSFARDLSRRISLPERATEELLAGLAEVVNNAISHAYAHENDGRVGVEFRRDSQSLVVTVQDQGCGFDAAAGQGFGAPSASTPGTPTLPSSPAHGLDNVRRLTDRVKIDSRRGRGTRVTLEKRFAR